jgi:uncharacterized membrane protein YdjX (TVP38/TMEM64 family)
VVSPNEESKPIPGSVWFRVALFAALLATGFALVQFTPIGDLFSEERLTGLLTEARALWWAPLLLIALYAIVSPLGLPVSPLIVGGAVFGALYGTLYNVAGMFVGAALSFMLAQLLGQDMVAHLVGKRLRRVERMFERHGFWPLVQARFIPIHFGVVNYGAALAGVRLTTFLIATLVGLIPSTLLHTYFIARLFDTHGGQRWMVLATYIGAFLVFNGLISLIWMRQQSERRERHRRLIALRAGRRASGVVAAGGKSR